MKIRLVKLPFYVKLLIFFACTDIYLVSGIKITYLFAVPIMLALINRGGYSELRKMYYCYSGLPATSYQSGML